MKTVSVERRTIRLAKGGFMTVLVAADPYSEEVLSELEDHLKYRVDIKSDRRKGDLNLWWAGIGLLHYNLSEEEEAIWPTTRKLHNAILDALGYTEREYKIDGSYRVVVDSVALDNMDQSTFSRMFEMARAVTVKRWGWDPWEEWKRIKDEEAARAKARAEKWRRSK